MSGQKDRFHQASCWISVLTNTDGNSQVGQTGNQDSQQGPFRDGSLGVLQNKKCKCKGFKGIRVSVTRWFLLLKTYLQVTRDVGSGQDSGGSGEKNGKHREERLLIAEIGREVLQKDFGFERHTKDSEDVSAFNLLEFHALEMTLTVVSEDSFGFLVLCGIKEGSYEHVHYGYQQDNEEHELGLWKAKRFR